MPPEIQEAIKATLKEIKGAIPIYQEHDASQRALLLGQVRQAVANEGHKPICNCHPCQLVRLFDCKLNELQNFPAFPSFAALELMLPGYKPVLQKRLYDAIITRICFLSLARRLGTKYRISLIYSPIDSDTPIKPIIYVNCDYHESSEDRRLLLDPMHSVVVDPVANTFKLAQDSFGYHNERINCHLHHSTLVVFYPLLWVNNEIDEAGEMDFNSRATNIIFAGTTEELTLHAPQHSPNPVPNYSPITIEYLRSLFSSIMPLPPHLQQSWRYYFRENYIADAILDIGPHSHLKVQVGRVLRRCGIPYICTENGIIIPWINCGSSAGVKATIIRSLYDASGNIAVYLDILSQKLEILLRTTEFKQRMQQVPVMRLDKRRLVKKLPTLAAIDSGQGQCIASIAHEYSRNYDLNRSEILIILTQIYYILKNRDITMRLNIKVEASLSRIWDNLDMIFTLVFLPNCDTCRTDVQRIELATICYRIFHILPQNIIKKSSEKKGLSGYIVLITFLAQHQPPLQAEAYINTAITLFAELNLHGTDNIGAKLKSTAFILFQSLLITVYLKLDKKQQAIVAMRHLVFQFWESHRKNNILYPFLLGENNALHKTLISLARTYFDNQEYLRATECYICVKRIIDSIISQCSQTAPKFMAGLRTGEQEIPSLIQTCKQKIQSEDLAFSCLGKLCSLFSLAVVGKEAKFLKIDCKSQEFVQILKREEKSEIRLQLSVNPKKAIGQVFLELTDDHILKLPTLAAMLRNALHKHNLVLLERRGAVVAPIVTVTSQASEEAGPATAPTAMPPPAPAPIPPVGGEPKRRRGKQKRQIAPQPAPAPAPKIIWEVDGRQITDLNPTTRQIDYHLYGYLNIAAIRADLESIRLGGQAKTVIDIIKNIFKYPRVVPRCNHQGIKYLHRHSEYMLEIKIMGQQYGHIRVFGKHVDTATAEDGRNYLLVEFCHVVTK